MKKVGLAKRGGLLAASALLLSSQWQFTNPPISSFRHCPPSINPTFNEGLRESASLMTKALVAFLKIGKVFYMEGRLREYIWGSGQLPIGLRLLYYARLATLFATLCQAYLIACYIMPGLLHCYIPTLCRLAALSQCSDRVHSYMT